MLTINNTTTTLLITTLIVLVYTHFSHTLHCAYPPKKQQQQPSWENLREHQP